MRTRCAGGDAVGHVFLFLLGFGLALSGGVTLIAYTNFLPAGISWAEYGMFVVGRIECYFFPLGLLFMTVAVVFYPNRSSGSKE